jgi:anti-sigma B factor antagonist
MKEEENVSQPTLTMKVRRPHERASIIDISGDITAASEDELMEAYNKASNDKVRAIVLNFDGLEYMNSGGIGLLVTLLVRANRQRQKIFAYGLSDHYRQIFELTRLDDAISIHDGESEALGAAGA